MDARHRWQSLQARLTAARAAVDAGDRATALAEVTAALEVDREFLAARALHDSILAMDPAAAAPPQTGASAGLASSEGAPSQPARNAEPAAKMPPGYAKFEQRARRRRVDRRVDAARAAIEQRRLKAAAAALDEVIDLDPNLPELAELTAQFDALRRATATPHRGPRIVAVGVFAAALLGGTWLQDSSTILSRQIVSAAPLPPALSPVVAMSERVTEVGTAGTVEPDDVLPRAAAVLRAPETRAGEARGVALADSLRLAPPAEMVPGIRAADPPHASSESAISLPLALPSPAATRVDAPDDHVLVTQVLQRYRTAYDGLDAQSAQAVWPAVNQAALARAFDGLQSQSLTFDACDIRLRGEAATATCHGSARYVTKVGSRDPRIEPRVWNFTLRKAGSDWKIDSARAER